MTPARPRDQSAIKRHNIERLLSTLEHCQPVSRTELAHLTEMSSASVTRFVSALTALGLVKEVSTTPLSPKGQSPTSRSSSGESIAIIGFVQLSPSSSLEATTHLPKGQTWRRRKPDAPTSSLPSFMRTTVGHAK